MSRHLLGAAVCICQDSDFAVAIGTVPPSIVASAELSAHPPPSTTFPAATRFRFPLPTQTQWIETEFWPAARVVRSTVALPEPSRWINTLLPTGRLLGEGLGNGTAEALAVPLLVAGEGLAWCDVQPAAATTSDAVPTMPASLLIILLA